MSRAKDREEFVAIMAREGVPVTVSRALMRISGTLHRLAEMECNGYGWEDHFKRIPCPNAKDETAGCDLCERAEAGAPHYETTRGVLYLIRTERRMRALAERNCAPYKMTPIFSGDPRGAVLKIKVPSSYTNSFGGEGVCVP